jgi:AcrR family transcriptional regulator
MAKRRYSSEDDPTRGRILDAALECISQTSVSALSVRAIAARAGVNVATAHYYFRTKDALVTEALHLFFAPLAARFEAIIAGPGSEKERLLAFLVFYSEQVHRNPGIFTSVVEAIIASNIRKEPGAPTSFEEVLIGIVSQARDRLMSLVGAVSGIGDQRHLAFRTLQVMTSLVHPILVSTLPGTLFGVDFGVEDDRRSYVEVLVAGLEGGRSASETTPRT